MISKRSKFILASILLSLFPFIGIKVFSQGYLYPILVYLGLVIWFTLWALSFELRGVKIIIFLIFPSLLAINNFFLFKQFSEIGQTFVLNEVLIKNLIAFGIFWYFYILFLTLNILRVSVAKSLPLKKAALSVFTLCGLILGFLSYRLLLTFYPFLLDWRLQVAVSVLVTWLVVVPVFWVVQEGKKRLMFKEALTISLIVTETGVLLAFFSSVNILRSLFIAGVLFILVNLMVKKIEQEMTTKIMGENIVILLVLIFFLYLSYLVR